MSCETCRQATSIPSCNETLEIGTIAHIGAEYKNFDVWVLLTNNSTGKMKMIPVTTDGDSKVILTDPKLNAGQSYTVSVVAANAYNLDDTLNIIVYDIAYEPTVEILCVDFAVVNIPYTGYGSGWITTLKLKQ